MGKVVRGRGRWVGVALLAAAAVGCLLAPLPASGAGEVWPRLETMAALFLVGAVTVVAASRARGPRSVVRWVALVVAGGACLDLLPLLRDPSYRGFARLVPVISPSGVDFRDGLYEPAAAFSSHDSIWPPLTLVLGRPFTLLSAHSGYLVQLVVLVVLGGLAAYLTAALCVGEAGTGAPLTPPDAGSLAGGRAELALVMGLWLFSSYGFLFELERGNVNLYALVLSLLAVWLLLRHPGQRWLCALCLAAAIGVKLFPATLLIVFFWKYRWKGVIPVLVTNVVVLLVAGPGNAVRFLGNLLATQGDPSGWFWPGNHSASSFGSYVGRAVGVSGQAAGVALSVLSLSLWVVTIVLLFRRGWSRERALLAAAASFPVMCTLPAVSHDYKLTQLVFPLAVQIVLLARTSRARPSLWAGAFAVTGLELVFLARSVQLPVLNLYRPDTLASDALLSNHYPWIVLLQLSLLGAVLSAEAGGARREAAAAAGGVCGAPDPARAAAAASGRDERS